MRQHYKYLLKAAQISQEIPPFFELKKKNVENSLGPNEQFCPHDHGQGPKHSAFTPSHLHSISSTSLLHGLQSVGNSGVQEKARSGASQAGLWRASHMEIKQGAKAECCYPGIWSTGDGGRNESKFFPPSLTLTRRGEKAKS